jgi:hypothetical protein
MRLRDAHYERIRRDVDDELPRFTVVRFGRGRGGESR